MKIAMVVLGGLHPSGDTQVVPSWLAVFEELARLHEVHAFALRHLDRAQTYSLRGVTVHDLGRPSALLGLTRAATERALTQALQSTGPFDLIHGFWADPAGQLAARAGQRLGIPSVVTCDGGEFVSIPEIGYGSQRTARGRRAVEQACSLATRLHVCTQFMASLAERHGWHPTIVPLTSVTTAARSWQTTPRRDSTLRLVQVASLSRVKNQRLLLDALAIVSKHVDVHLDLVGEDTLSSELHRHSASIGLERRVTFHGFLPQSGVHELLSSADLYVQSSMHEAAGVSVLEAAAHGVPTVGTAFGYVADWTPTMAVAVSNATTDSLADAIGALAADVDRRQSIAARAHEFAVTHDAAWVAAEFDRIYASLR